VHYGLPVFLGKIFISVVFSSLSHSSLVHSPGDRQAIPGYLKALREGKTKVQIGDNNNLFDWTYIDNLVHAHLLAAEKLGTSVSRSEFERRIGPVGTGLGRRELPTSVHRVNGVWLEGEQPGEIDPEIDAPLPAARNRFDQFFSYSDSNGDHVPVAGQAYFITNGEPVPFWDSARYVWYIAGGHVAPYTVVLPRAVGILFGALSELWAALRGEKNPLFTRTRVRYFCSKRYFNIEKARLLLGYEPLVGTEEGMRRAVEVCV
jgi:sterol-4alpha-carboxylate 3-dehydrogenase (decarboxylating)